MEQKAAAKLPGRSMPTHFKVFLSYFIPYWPSFLFGMLFIFLSGILQLLSISLIGKLIDKSVDQGSQQIRDNINTIVFQILSVMLLQIIFSMAQQYFFLRMNEAAIAGIRKTLYNRYLRYSLSFFNKERVGDLMSRINNDIGMVQYIFSEQLPAFFYQSVILLTAITALLLINIKLTLLMIFTFPVTVIITLLIGKKVRQISRQIQDAFAVSVVYMEETLQKIRTVKAFSNESVESRKYNILLDSIVAKSIRRSVFRLSLDGTSAILMIVAQIVIMWYGSHLVSQGEVTIGKMIAFIMITFSVGSAVSSIASAFGNLQKSFGSTERLYELLSEDMEEGVDIVPQQEIHIGEGFQFHHVHFSYKKNEEEPVLANLNFDIRKGEKVGIIGPSGVGKSTIVQLLMRFYQPDSGIITLDSHDIRQLPLYEYRRLFGIVSQEIELFGTTIRDNICYGRSGSTEAEIIAAAKHAHAYEFISELPDGFDTALGENGYTLSGGQRQRIALARAILADPPVLLLDEATSALDANTEMMINETMEKLIEHKTVLIVSHRLTTIRKMDKILVFRNGQVIESGTHDQLMKIPDGRYRQITQIYGGDLSTAYNK